MVLAVNLAAPPPYPVFDHVLQAPIASTYVDVFLSGAQELQTAFGLEGEAYRTGSPDQQYSSFMEETIRTTYGWSR